MSSRKILISKKTKIPFYFDIFVGENMQVLLELRVVPLEQKCLLVLFSEKKHEKLHGELNFNQRIWLKNVCFCNRGSFYLFIFFCHCKIYFLMCTTVVVLQSFSCVWLFVTPWTVACQASLSFIISRVCSNSGPLSQWAIQPSHPLSSPSPAFSLSQH